MSYPRKKFIVPKHSIITVYPRRTDNSFDIYMRDAIRLWIELHYNTLSKMASSTGVSQNRLAQLLHVFGMEVRDDMEQKNPQ